MLRLLLIVSLILLNACSSAKYATIKPPSEVISRLPDQDFTATLKTIITIAESDLVKYCRNLNNHLEQSYSTLFLQLVCAKRWLALDLSNEQTTEAISQLNKALEPLVRLALSGESTKNLQFQLRITPSSYHGKFEEITFASDVTATDPFTLTTPGATIGIGLIGKKPNSGADLDKWYPPEGIFRALTALPVKLDTTIIDVPVLTIDIQQPRQATWKIAANTYPITYDLATPYLLLAEAAEINEYELTGLFLASRVEDKLGIYAIEEIVPDKIPILMIHGLNSSPMIWRRLSWALYANPELARRYQIWHAFYPSGPPPFYSAMLIKEKLNALIAELDFPDAAIVKNEMWLIGHSMGGIISRTFVVDSDMQLWDRTFTVPPSALNLPENEVQAFKNIFILEPNSNIKGVLFLETPHRGSDTSGKFIGRFASAIIRLPLSMQQLFSKIWERDLAHYVTAEMAPYMTRTGPDSVRVLSPKHPLLQGLSQLEPVVPVYSVIGNNNPEICPDNITCPTLNDGVVDYSSAHLAEAASEIIVESQHNAYQSPEAIAFILEVLASPIKNN